LAGGEGLGLELAASAIGALLMEMKESGPKILDFGAFSR